MKTITGLRLHWGVSLFFIFTVEVGAATRTLINFGSPWRYHDYGVDPGPNWNSAGYGDGSWKFNFAQFGYGEGDEQTTLAPVTTAYFRTFLTVTNPQEFAAFTFRVLRDDGVAVYVNGTQVLRDNLPAGPLTYSTLAMQPIEPPNESTQVVATVSPSAFVAGVNLIAVEVHQFATNDDDLSFNLELAGTLGTSGPPGVVRGPYLQAGTPSNIVVRWRTSAPSDSRVWFGTNSASLNFTASNSAPVLDHEVTLENLWPDTKYFYAVGVSTQALAGDATFFFVTAPAPNSTRPLRIWATGDFGTGYAAQRNVRDAYTNFTATRYTDAWLMLGDNAYSTGTDEQYQAYVFNVYPTILRQTVAWPTVGNHDTAFSSELRDDFPYFEMFTMPQNGQAGGVPSGSEHYYSFDLGHVHFICLDSMTAVLRQPNSPMLAWLQADLADTARDWIIAYWHHPPYTKGSHNSDTETELVQMRQNVVPILESFGVDLVLAGHSHAYERSFLINGHYGDSSTTNAAHFLDRGDGRTNGTGPYLKPAGGLGANHGTVYVVDGSSGGQAGGGALNHPVMFYSTLTPGSLVLDINGLRLDATFLSQNGTVDDAFTLLKQDYPGAPRPELNIVRAGTNAVLSWPTSVPDYELERRRTLEASPWLPVNATAVTNGRRKSVMVPADADRQFYRLKSVP